MSLTFARKVIEGLQKYGVTVHLWPDWERRGNGQISDYEGGIMHHTATAYGFAPSVLVSGRSDLSGPLCNSSGNSDGSVTIIAAHPANHAGASGGKSMGPLPITSSFNKRVWGHEIVYPGTSPMTAAQYKTMIILGKVITEILGRPNSEWIRLHGETSITGKWDAGYALGKMIDGNKVRQEINSFRQEVDNDVSADEVWKFNITNVDDRKAGVTGPWAQDALRYVDKRTWSLLNKLNEMDVYIRQQFGNLSDDESKILAAIQTLKSVVENKDLDVTEADLDYIADKVANAIPVDLVDRFDQKLRERFGKAAQ